MQFLGYDSNVHIQRSQDSGGRIRDSYTNVSMTLFAAVLELMGSRTPLDKLPVVDMTGKQGGFDFTVVQDRFQPQPHEGGEPSAADDVLADYKPILQRELGLTLESRKAMVDVLVVDHADKIPTEN